MEAYVTHGNDIVRICAMEVGYPYTWWERLLSLERLVQTLAEIWLDTECLEYEDTHAHEALLGRIVALVDRIVQD